MFSIPRGASGFICCPAEWCKGLPWLGVKPDGFEEVEEDPGWPRGMNGIRALMVVIVKMPTLNQSINLIYYICVYLSED